MNKMIRKQAKANGLSLRHMGGMMVAVQNRKEIVRVKGLKELGRIMREEDSVQRANLKRLRQWGNVGKIG